MTKYLYKHSTNVLKLTQLVHIMNKTALTLTSLRSIEKLFHSKELMAAIKEYIVVQNW